MHLDAYLISLKLPLSGMLPLTKSFSSFSDAENVTDSQVPFIPSVEVLVKALVVIAPVVSARGPDACVQLLLCVHHPCIIGTRERSSVWRVSFTFSWPCFDASGWVELNLFSCFDSHPH